MEICPTTSSSTREKCSKMETTQPISLHLFKSHSILWVIRSKDSIPVVDILQKSQQLIVTIITKIFLWIRITPKWHQQPGNTCRISHLTGSSKSWMEICLSEQVIYPYNKDKIRRIPLKKEPKINLLATEFQQVALKLQLKISFRHHRKVLDPRKITIRDLQFRRVRDLHNPSTVKIRAYHRDKPLYFHHQIQQIRLQIFHHPAPVDSNANLQPKIPTLSLQLLAAQSIMALFLMTTEGHTEINSQELSKIIRCAIKAINHRTNWITKLVPFQDLERNKQP